MNLKETYNRIAEDWYKDHQSDDWWIKGTDKFISLLRPGAKVLDVGCGAGVKTKYLKDMGINVSGIDFSDKLIEIAKRQSPSIDFRVMDMREITRLNNKFDGIFAQASLLHIPKKEILNVIGNLIKILNEGGLIYIAVKGVNEDGKEEDILKENDYGYEYERFFSYYTMEELKKYFTNLGLEIVYENNTRVRRTDWLQIIGKR